MTHDAIMSIFTGDQFRDKHQKREHWLVITGYMGFIGFNTLREFLGNENLSNKYHRLILVDAGYLKPDPENPNPMNIWMAEDIFNVIVALKEDNDIPIDVVDNIRFDLRDYVEEHSKDVVPRIEILNFASESHVDVSIDKPFGVFNANTTIIPNLIEAVGGLDAITKFWHIRTDEEFGHLKSKHSPPFLRTSKIQPRNPYAASKAAQTLFLDSLKTTYGLDVRYFVLSNQFGPYQHYTKMIPVSVQRHVQGQTVKIYGDGENYREWTPVRATASFITDQVLGDGSAFDDSSIVMCTDPNNGMTNNQLIEKLCERLDKEDNPVQVEFVKDRKGHDRAYSIKPCGPFICHLEKFYKTSSFESELNGTFDFFFEYFTSSL